MPTDPPTTAHKIAIHSYTSKSWEYSGYSNQITTLDKRRTQQIPTPVCTSLEETDKEQTTPSNTLIPLNSNQISQLIQIATTKCLQTGTDRSIIENKMTCAWAIEIGTEYPSTGGTIQKGSGKANSTRAERAGICFLLMNLDYIFTKHNISNAKIEIHTDNIQALEYSSLPEKGAGLYKFLIDDYDIISTIDSMKKRFRETHKTNIKYSHIYSHLNNKAKRDHIQLTKGHHILQQHLKKTTARKLNEVCDKEATLQHNNNTQLIIPIKPQVISILVQGTNITSKNLNIIHSLTNSQNYVQYLKEKFTWDQETFNSIDWKSLTTFIQTLPLEQKVSFIKHSHKWRPTNKKLIQMEYDETENSECMLCNEIEDDDHPFQCNDPIMQDAQEETLEILKTSLTKIHTSTTITSTIITHLRQWMRNTELSPSQSLHPDIKYHQEIQKAINQQNKIGWDHFICGRISGQWKIAQKLFLKTKYKSRWPILCIKSIKDATQKVWEIRNLIKFGTKPQVYTNHQKRLQPTIKSYYATF